jgi:hypothetical protein
LRTLSLFLVTLVTQGQKCFLKPLSPPWVFTATRNRITEKGALAFLSLPLELLLEVLQEVGIEILTTQVGVTSSGLDGKDTTLDVQEGNIESSTTEIVDENVTLLGGLSGTETVSNGGSGRLVDDTENVEASNGTGVLGSLTLVVVEVSWDSDDGLGDLLAQLNLGDLLHL